VPWRSVIFKEGARFNTESFSDLNPYLLGSPEFYKETQKKTNTHGERERWIERERERVSICCEESNMQVWPYIFLLIET
jgi:hypothetical protein